MHHDCKPSVQLRAVKYGRAITTLLAIFHTWISHTAGGLGVPYKNIHHSKPNNYSRIGISTVFQEIVICNGMFASHVMETDVKVGKGSYHRLF